MRSVVKQSGRSQELMSLVDRWIEAQDCRHLWRQVPSWSVSCQQRAAQCLSQGDSRCNLAPRLQVQLGEDLLDRKSTRLNSSHGSISYAVFCLKKKIKICK